MCWYIEHRRTAAEFIQKITKKLTTLERFKAFLIETPLLFILVKNEVLVSIQKFINLTNREFSST